MGAENAGSLDAPTLWQRTGGVALRLGRVSNLPTVWTNVLAGAVLTTGFDGTGPLSLGTGPLSAGPLIAVILSASLFYEAGMFLNDACDRGIDARERPDRPIPAGLIRARTVALAAVAMMALGLVLVLPLGLPAALAAAALGLTILAYDLWHKGNPLSPLIMGGCRALVYALAALGLGGPWDGSPAAPWILGAVAMLFYVAGLTYAARQENMAEFRNAWPLAMLAVPVILLLAVAGWDSAPFLLLFTLWMGWGLRLILVPAVRDIRRAVGGLIAGIALLDAGLIAACGHPGLALLAVAGWGLTLAAHRRVQGT